MCRRVGTVESDFSASAQACPAEEEKRVDVIAHPLFVNFVAVYIILAIYLYTDTICFDQYLEKFEALVEVSKVILDAKHSRRFSFWFNSGTTPWLYRPGNGAETVVGEGTLFGLCGLLHLRKAYGIV